MPEIAGWIDDVHDGRVWGRLIADGEEFEFDMLVSDVLECQRGDMQPGAYVTFPNGYLLISKTMWTTHDIEQADREARRRFKALGWDRPRALVALSQKDDARAG